MNERRTIIVGCGPAGAFAAKRLKRNDPNMKIQIFDAARDGFYARMRLPEYIAGTLKREALVLGSEDAIAGWGCEPHLGEPVLSIRTADNAVVTEKGTYFFDALLFATGSSAFMPPIPGASGNPRVRSLRTIEDADAILAMLQGAKRAVIVGGGLLGLEAAHAIHSHGVETLVLEQADRLLPRQLAPEGSQELTRLLKEQGCDCAAGVSVERIEGGVVCLSNGTLPEADLIVFSAGIRSNIGAAQEAGIVCRRGIVVDESLRTSCERIWAAGDCAEFDGKTPGLWLAAKTQGETAADSICGLPASIAGWKCVPMLKIPGVDLSKLQRIAD